MSKTLLDIRRESKSRKPVFIRHKGIQLKRLGLKWRRPKGLHSKMRLSKKGHPRAVSDGWRSPKEVRYLSKEGLVQKMVSTPSDIDKINKKTDGIIISGSVGNKKRLDIIKKAADAGVKILNLKDPEKFAKSIENNMAMRKSDKESRLKEKSAKKKELETKRDESGKDEIKKDENKKDESKNLAEKVDEEEKKARDKKEKDRLLTKKDILK